MNNFGNFLWKIFSATMVFFFHVGSEYAIADECDTPPETTKYYTVYTKDFASSTDPKISSDSFVDKDEIGSRITTKLSICPYGTYLARCGMANVGINWLKGMTKKGGITTPDFYSYAETGSSTSALNMDNLRTFFGHTESFQYTSRTQNSSSEESSSKYTYEQKTALTTGAGNYKTTLYQILSNYCTDDKGRLVNIECETCPNNAKVAPSKVEEDTYCTGKILWNTWDVHTIADCYMTEFSDTTGSYVYIPNNISVNENNASQDKLNCYYSSTENGSTLYYK